MKQEWKPDEMRANAEEIREAIMPKSVTPEMVGGTLLGLVNAVGEVVEVLGEIPREHVKVKVRGYDGEAGVSGAGATVWLDIFHTKGYPITVIPRQELTADGNGVVEFDVPHGFKYAVFSQIDGLGASFQLVKTAATESREIALWNLPIGIKHLYMAALYRNTDDLDIYRCIPKVTDTYVTELDWEDEDLMAEWGWDADMELEETFDDWCYYGILVSTADTSFVIGENSFADERMAWCSNHDFGTLIPGIPAFNGYDENGNYNNDLWDEAQMKASADMDGNINTAKILDFCNNPIAANFCTDYIGRYDEQRWLPSAGQLALMQLNHIAINALMTEAIEADDRAFNLLPYKKTNGSWDHYEWWWSSTIYDEFSSWFVTYTGDIDSDTRLGTLNVRAVSAFHFEY